MVELYYTNGMHFETEGYTVTPSGPLKESDDHVTLSITEGGKTASVDITIKVTRTEIPVPAQRNSPVYTGGALSPEWSNWDAAKMTKSGTESQVNAGTYEVTFKCNDAYTFPSNEHEKVVTWSIAKANGSLTVQPQQVTLNADLTETTVTVSHTGDGVISISGGTDVVTSKLEGAKVTITAKQDEKGAYISGNTTITVKMADGVNYKGTTASITVEAAFAQVYGVTWDGTAGTTWSRTDAAQGFRDPTPATNNGSGSSPFDGIMPWAGMTHEKRTAGEMVKIPKFWYKLEASGNGLSIKISNGEKDGFQVSPAHMDRKDGKGERNEVYVGRYHCGTDYKSNTGQSPKGNETRSQFRDHIHALGDNIWQMDFATRFTIWLLYIVEFADWNSQAKIGYGCGNNSGVQAMGYTDKMQYHTGTSISSRTSYGLGTQYRYIEGLWDNVYDWCDGCYYNGTGMYVILKPSDFSDSANGQLVGKPTSGYPSKFTVSSTGGFPAFYPTTSNGSETTYSCDYWDYYSSNPCLCVGGYYSQDQNHGLFYVSCNSTTDKGANRGSRPLELP